MINAPKISLSCRKPKKQWIHKTERTSKGAKLISMKSPQDTYNWEESKIRCGKCLPCALYQSTQAGKRVQDELLSFTSTDPAHKTLFLTLTVDDEYLEEIFPNGELRKRPFQLFIKKIRKHYKGNIEITHPTNGKKYKPIRYFMCGEYGEKNLRPHYHVIIFNWTPPDLKTKKGRGAYTKYFSRVIEELWPYGLVDIGTASFQSGAYIGRYTAKKYSQKDEPRLAGKFPAYIEYPRGFGLGRMAYEEHKESWYSKDFRWHVKEIGTGNRAKTGAFKTSIAPYYNRLRRKEDLQTYETIVDKRVQRGQKALLDRYKNSSIYQAKCEKSQGDFTERFMSKKD